MWFCRRLAWLSAVPILVACSSSTLDEQPASTSKSALSTKLLMYEGTCDFLRECSSFSRNLPAGQVQWGCEGVADCDDDDHWVAGPSHSYCGKTVTLCKGSMCTTARVRDVSSAQGWEASNGVLDALGLPHGLRGHCAGYGGGNVTITLGSTQHVAPPPPPLPSSTACDEGLLYCGGQGVGDDAGTLYRCDNQQPVFVETCVAGCQIMPEGQSDVCNPSVSNTGPDLAPPPDPSPADSQPQASCMGLGDGYYCGDDDVNGDPDTLYWCGGGIAQVAQACANGCRTNPAPDDDECW
jgi:hypothetical protein